MKIPASIYGSAREVRLRMRKMVKALAKGASFEAVIGADALIDTQACDGWFVCGLKDAFGGQPQFYIDRPWEELWSALYHQTLPPAFEEMLFYTCLESAWGVLILLPYHRYGLFDDRHRWVPFLRAAARFWPVLLGEGARFKTGPWMEPKTVAHEATTLDYVLANLGICQRPQRDPWELVPIPPLPLHWPELFEAYVREHEPSA